MNSEREVYREVLGDLCPGYEHIELVKRRAESLQQNTKGTSGRMPRWLVPALGAACAGLIVCTALPQVRAGIADFFTGSAEYLSAPAEERPEIENVNVQAVSSAPWEIHAYAGADFEWSDAIRDFRVEEALFDGTELTLRYTVDAAGSGIGSAENLAFLPAGTTALPCIGGARIVQHPELIADIEAIPVEEGIEYLTPPEFSHHGEETVAAGDNGRITHTSVFDLDGVSPEDDLALIVWCANASDTGDGGVHFEYMGFLEVPLEVDLRQPPVRKAAAKTVTVNGTQITITRSELRPTGLVIDFEVPLNEWTEYLDFNVYADGERLTGGPGFPTDSCLDHLWDGEEGMLEGQLRAPFAAGSIHELRLVPVDRSTATAYEDHAIELILE